MRSRTVGPRSPLAEVEVNVRLQQKPQLAQETRNNLSHLLSWSLGSVSRTFPTKFVHGFSLAVPLLGLSGERPRTDQVMDTQEGKAPQDGSLPSCSKAAASLGKGNAFPRLGSHPAGRAQGSNVWSGADSPGSPLSSATQGSTTPPPPPSLDPKHVSAAGQQKPVSMAEPAGRYLPRGRRKPDAREERP